MNEITKSKLIERFDRYQRLRNLQSEISNHLLDFEEDGKYYHLDIVTKDRDQVNVFLDWVASHQRLTDDEKLTLYRHYGRC